MASDRARQKLVDRLVPHPAWGPLQGLLATTYELDPDFFDADLLPSVLGLRSWDDRSRAARIGLERALAGMVGAVLLMDARPYRGRPRSLRVEVRPSVGAARELLHAKVLLLVYERCVRLAVGSMNLTERGYRRNLEVASVLDVSAADGTHATALRTAIEDLPERLATWWSPGASAVRDLALARIAEWEAPAEDGLSFVWSGPQVPLWRSLSEAWRGGPIERITIVSPFWSDEDPDTGPLATWCRAWAGRVAPGAELRLLAAATTRPDGTVVPSVPPSILRFDARQYGLVGRAWAVAPKESPEDWGRGQEVARDLHAKVVLVEGEGTQLAYIGSANFSKPGWGFSSQPLRFNHEAGLLLQATDGRLSLVVPDTAGDPLALVGAQAPDGPAPDEADASPPWPEFLDEVRLCRVGDEVQLRVAARAVPDGGAWVVVPELPLVAVRSEPVSVALAEGSLVALLRAREVRVRWGDDCEADFPLNVDEGMRDLLPMTDDGRPPEEGHLLAYYLGRIPWEDVFPEPIDGGDAGGADPRDDAGVETARIQAYQVREFVEALHGLRADLAEASRSPTSMRLAVLGPVSPVALAQRVMDSDRTPTAKAFQLVELLAAVVEARRHEVADDTRERWLGHLDDAESSILECLALLGDATTERTFRHYRDQVLGAAKGAS